MVKPRGIRNNNPLNIRRGNSKWQGMKPRQTDRDFCQFATIDYGYRAAFKLMQTYYEKYGVRSVADLIGRWAPPSENRTREYVANVMYDLERQGFDYDARQEIPAPWRDKRLWCAIARAICRDSGRSTVPGCRIAAAAVPVGAAGRAAVWAAGCV